MVCIPGTHTSSGAQLAEALKGNSSLKVLDIGGNNIGPEGIKVLLESLRGNLTLKTLEIGYNPIGEEGAKYLADVVKYDLGVSHPGSQSCNFTYGSESKIQDFVGTHLCSAVLCGGGGVRGLKKA